MFIAIGAGLFFIFRSKNPAPQSPVNSSRFECDYYCDDSRRKIRQRLPHRKKS